MYRIIKSNNRKCKQIESLNIVHFFIEVRTNISPLLLNQCPNQHHTLNLHNHIQNHISHLPNLTVRFRKRHSLLLTNFFFIAMSKPSVNTNKLGSSNPGNRAIQRGSKGSALLNRNDNANQVARCYACGINIR